MEVETCALAPTDWRIRTVEDVCVRVTSGGTPSRSRHDFYLDGVWPWVKTQELQDTWIDQTDERITEEAVANSSAKVLPANTILLAMYGATVGQLGILRRPMTCNQACCAMVVAPARADFRFVFYQLRHSRSQLKSLATGAAQQNLSGALIRSLRLPFPPLPEQRAIASVLGALDDKIDLNRRMCQTLEEMARALFKSWFVDFDPVRAKMEGRDPGLPKEIADLFPSRLVDSDLGPIPEGWSAKPLDEVADFLNGLALQKDPPGDGAATLPVLKISQLKRGDTLGADRCSSEVPAPYQVVDGDLIFSWSGSLEVALWTGGAAALNQHLFKVTSDRFPSWCLYQWVCQHLPEFRQIAAGKATTMGHIQRCHLSAARVAVPSEKVRQAADSTLGPMTDRILAARTESRTLAALRDTLLPKLISGELRVPASLGTMQEDAS